MISKTDNRLPTVSEIIEVITKMPYEVERCRFIHRDKPATFTDEVYIQFIGVWVNLDGKRYSGDLGRGFYYPGWYDAWRLRRALRKCGEQHGWL